MRSGTFLSESCTCDEQVFVAATGHGLPNQLVRSKALTPHHTTPHHTTPHHTTPHCRPHPSPGARKKTHFSGWMLRTAGCPMSTRTIFFFYPIPTQNLKNEQKASQESIRKMQFLPALPHQNSRILCKPAENQDCQISLLLLLSR